MSDSSPEPRTPSEEIAGLVERVTFFNEESGFAVLRVKVRGHRELVTVLGSLPAVSAGEWLTAKGWWVRDKEHGLQFKAQVLKAVPPTTSEGVERYLAGGFVKGVGPVLAKKLVGHFGAEVLGVISDNPADLKPADRKVMGVQFPLRAPCMLQNINMLLDDLHSDEALTYAHQVYFGTITVQSASG